MAIPHIDHIILLLPHTQLLSPPSWLTQNFTLAPGGRHADGKTENKLIIFQDGTYIELIAFIPEEGGEEAGKERSRKGHWWGGMDWGFCDWALGLKIPGVGEGGGGDEEVERKSAEVFAEVQRRVDDDATGSEGKQDSIRYADPRPGGRIKPDGVTIKWTVAFPENVTRGEVPFWCFDVTDRNLRVPCVDGEYTRHPCGAVGVGGIAVGVPGESGDEERGFEELKGVMDGVFGRKGRRKDGQEGGGMAWECEVPFPVEGRGGRKAEVSLVRDQKRRGAAKVLEINIVTTDASRQGDGNKDGIRETVNGQDICFSFSPLA